ncbi:MAG: AraC family transcriptional regulator [Oscillospiraceae bacterium]
MVDAVSNIPIDDALEEYVEPSANDIYRDSAKKSYTQMYESVRDDVAATAKIRSERMNSVGKMLEYLIQNNYVAAKECFSKLFAPCYLEQNIDRVKFEVIKLLRLIMRSFYDLYGFDLNCDNSNFEINKKMWGLSDLKQVRLLLNDFFFVLMNYCSIKGKYKEPSLIEEITRYIEMNYDKQITLQMIADITQKSPAYICRYFSEKTGNTIKKFINKIRMEKACELLVSTTCSVREISERIGFSDSRYFYRSFKASNHMTCSQYRKAYHN